MANVCVPHGQVEVTEKSKRFNIRPGTSLDHLKYARFGLLGSGIDCLYFENDKEWSEYCIRNLNLNPMTKLADKKRYHTCIPSKIPLNHLLFWASFKNLHYYYAIFAYMIIWDAVDGYASRGSHVFASLCPHRCCLCCDMRVCDENTLWWALWFFFVSSKFLFPRVAILTCPENGVRICPFRSKNISFFGIRSSSRNVQVG